MGILHLHNWEASLCVLLLVACTTLGQFSHKKPWPTYSLQNMPQTRFTCHDKILGGYYADPETQCQMFHVCVKVAGVGVQDFRFLCPNGTAFDQEAQICADWGDVDCEQAVLYYGSDNFDLYRLGSGFESKRAPLAEEEEATFHLQRAETGDIRRSKETRVDQKLRPETQSYTKKYETTTRSAFEEDNSANRKSNYDQNNDFQRVTQRFDAPKKTTSSYYTTPRGNDFHNSADSKQDVDDLFKGSHSSNFFSNRNGGREDGFYESKPTTTTTTTTLRPYNPPSQFYNGNAPQSDFSDFNKIPDVSTKRPHRGRRPIAHQNTPNSLVSNPTSRPSSPSTTYATTVPDIPKTTKKLTVQSSYSAGFNFGNDQFYRPTSSSSSTSTTTSTTTQRTSSTAQKFPFGGNDYQQNIQPTTYSPSSAFRYKTTTSKYEDINETALRGEKPGQNTFFNSQYENQNFEAFNRVTNRKPQNSERNIQKQQAKNTTLANRNEFTDFTKNKTPSGFQVPSLRGPQAQSNAPQGPVNLGLNVQPLDPNKLNAELRNINQTQQPHRGRVPISRFNDRQQTEPQYFRTRPQETPAPFAVPQVQQQQAQKQFDNNFNASPQKEFSRVRLESRTSVAPLPQPQQQQASKPFDQSFNSYNSPQREVSRTRTEQRTNPESQQQHISKPFDSSFSGFSSPQREVSRTRTEQRTGGPTNVVPQSQPQQQGVQPFDSNFNTYISPQRTRSEQRTGNVVPNTNRDSSLQQQQQQPPSSFNGFQNSQRDINRIRAEPRAGIVSNQDTAIQPQQQQGLNQFESNFSGFNSPPKDISRTKAEPRTGSAQYADAPTRDSFQQKDYNRIKSDLITTTGASTGSSPQRGRGRIQYKATTQHQGRSLDNFVQSTTSAVKKFSTLVPKDQYYPTTFKPTTYKKAFEQKPTKHIEPKSRGIPYTTTTTALPSTSAQSFNTPDEDDGQYHPELYEADYSRNNVSPTKRPAVQIPSFTEPSPSTPQQRPQPKANAQTTRSPQAHLQSQQQTTFHKETKQPQNNFQQKYSPATPTDLSDEEELFKTAHSLNLGAASINKLRADTLKTADKTPLQSSLNFGFDRSTYPTTISPAPLTVTSTTTWRPSTSFISTTTTVRPPSASNKPKKASSSKRPPHADADTSYDYAYYDSLSETPQEYSEYDVISEFRKTKHH